LWDTFDLELSHPKPKAAFETTTRITKADFAEERNFQRTPWWHYDRKNDLMVTSQRPYASIR
jgi:hypothetical protein